MILTVAEATKMAFPIVNDNNTNDYQLCEATKLWK